MRKIPSNRAEVLAMFILESGKKNIEIESINEDGHYAIMSFGGHHWSVAFELTSENFDVSQPRSAECNLLVCWNHKQEKPVPLTVIRLRDELWYKESYAPMPVDKIIIANLMTKLEEGRNEIQVLKKRLHETQVELHELKKKRSKGEESTDPFEPVEQA